MTPAEILAAANATIATINAIEKIVEVYPTLKSRVVSIKKRMDAVVSKMKSKL